MKTLDALSDVIHESVFLWTAAAVSDEEIKELRQSRKESISSLCSRWFKYGEYLTVEIDTEAQTCVVVEAKRI